MAVRTTSKGTPVRSAMACVTAAVHDDAAGDREYGPPPWGRFPLYRRALYLLAVRPHPPAFAVHHDQVRVAADKREHPAFGPAGQQDQLVGVARVADVVNDGGGRVRGGEKGGPPVLEPSRSNASTRAGIPAAARAVRVWVMSIV